MNEVTLSALLIAAASIAFTHTLVGVDHYLPFVVLNRSQQWSLKKTLTMTAVSGVGHVVGSVLLGMIGIALGVALKRLEWVESVRGGLASWGLIAFGLVYAAWALTRRQAHHHQTPTSSFTFWSVFLVFVLGPCEPLIPLLMFPASQGGWGEVALVTATFAVITIGTMLAMVTIGVWGLGVPKLGFVEKHAHAFAGLAIATSGLAIQVLGI